MEHIAARSGIANMLVSLPLLLSSVFKNRHIKRELGKRDVILTGAILVCEGDLLSEIPKCSKAPPRVTSFQGSDMFSESR